MLKGVHSKKGNVLHESLNERLERNIVTKGIREILHVNCRGLMSLSVINSTADSCDQCMFPRPNRTALSRAIRDTHVSQ